MSELPAILLVDPDATSQKLVAGAFNRAGFNCRFIKEAKKTVGGLRLLQPRAVLVHAELAAALLKDVLEALASDVAFASVPVVLLASDLKDAPLLAPFRTGLVEILPLPFAAGHSERLKALLEQLPERTGRLAGQGERAELSRLVEHVRRVHRSGVLQVDPLTPEEGKAFFANGVLKSAQQGQRAGSAALAAMLARPYARWIFSEMGDEAESAAVVIEVGGDEPVISVTGDSDEGISLEVDAPLSEEFLLEEVVDEPTPAPRHVGPPIPILLVDDDPELCQMFGHYFTKHGFHVTTAPDGVQGYALALAQPFEAIVADLNMPRMDGWGMLRQLREDFRSRETPVAFLSCHDDYRESLKALDAGAQAYLSKSTKLDALAIQVREVLEPRAAFKKAIQAGQTFAAALPQVGPQWALRELCRANARGRLDAKDGWATFQLFFRDGALLHARSQSGRHVADGERALLSFIACRGADASVSFGEFPSPRSFTAGVEEVLARCDQTLNENEKNLRDGLMLSGTEIQVNDELYRLYAQVGPKHWLEAARLLCEEKLPPREVLAQATLSPIEVEEAMRDLIRRGVVRLSA